MPNQIALFGEAGGGSYATLLHFTNLTSLAETLGNPPDDTRGIPIAVQTLLFQYEILYIRVREEGFSKPDYLLGLRLLRDYKPKLSAICIPGVGDQELIRETCHLCKERKSLLITSERDFYDFLTDRDCA